MQNDVLLICLFPFFRRDALKSSLEKTKHGQMLGREIDFAVPLIDLKNPENESLLTKIDFDVAENGHFRLCQKLEPTL